MNSDALNLEPPLLTDVNVTLSHWPGRSLPLDHTPRLVEQLRASGVVQAWAGNFDSLLHNDIEAVNRRTAAECRQSGGGILLPVGCVNPALPDWQEDVRRCAQVHQMRMIRLHPGYHDYLIADSEFEQLLDLAAEHRLIVQLSVRIEDPRTQHPRLRAADVELAPLAALLRNRPKLPVILLNCFPGMAGTVLSELASLPNVYVDISTLEGVGGISRLLPQFPMERILFGSHAPFFLMQSSLLKLQESELGSHILQSIAHLNAQRLVDQVQ